MKNKRPISARPCVWKWAFSSALLLAGFVLFVPPIQVLWVKVFPPPFTGTILQRRLEAALEGREPRRLSIQWVPESQIPAEFFRAVWTSEDQRFFDHRGFDWVEIGLLREEILAGRGAARGASTITMQTARTVFLWQGRSWLRKGLEAYYTIWMELLLSKPRILELYANTVELGPDIHGIYSAARIYFGVVPENLKRTQCVLLAAVLPNPRFWSPVEPSRAVRTRAERISKRMKAARYPAELLKMGSNVDRRDDDA